MGKPNRYSWQTTNTTTILVDTHTGETAGEVNGASPFILQYTDHQGNFKAEPFSTLPLAKKELFRRLLMGEVALPGGVNTDH